VCFEKYLREGCTRLSSQKVNEQDQTVVTIDLLNFGHEKMRTLVQESEVTGPGIL